MRKSFDVQFNLEIHFLRTLDDQIFCLSKSFVYLLAVQKSHTIKNKLLDVKKAISKQEMDRHRGDSRGGMGNGYGGYSGGNYGGESDPRFAVVSRN